MRSLRKRSLRNETLNCDIFLTFALEAQFFGVFRMPSRKFLFLLETSNGRLPLEQSSDRRETLAKHVSDDLQFFSF